jgi:hypothetical protein
MSERQALPTVELTHAAMSEDEARQFLDGCRISRGGPFSAAC